RPAWSVAVRNAMIFQLINRDWPAPRPHQQAHDPACLDRPITLKWRETMPFELPPLPYAQDALQPHISAETLEYHYGKNHNAYVIHQPIQIAGSAYEGQSLEEIITTSSGGLFNNAAQVWKHTFCWNCLSRIGGRAPTGELPEAINNAFGSF